MTDAYNFLDIEAGRAMAQDLFIGAYHNDIDIDHAYDHVMLRELFHGVFWDFITGNGPFPSPIDAWVLSNGTALVVGRMDGLEVSNMFAGLPNTGILLTDSPDTSQNPRCGYGTGSWRENIRASC